MAKRNVSTILANYLPKSGGTLSGSLGISALSKSRLIVEKAYTENSLVFGDVQDVTAIRGTGIVFQNNLGEWDFFYRNRSVCLGGHSQTFPTHKFHVVGDIYCTGKLITEGGVEDRSQSAVSQQIVGGGGIETSFSAVSGKGGWHEKKRGLERPAVYERTVSNCNGPQRIYNARFLPIWHDSIESSNTAICFIWCGNKHAVNRRISNASVGFRMVWPGIYLLSSFQYDNVGRMETIGFQVGYTHNRADKGRICFLADRKGVVAA